MMRSQREHGFVPKITRHRRYTQCSRNPKPERTGVSVRLRTRRFASSRIDQNLFKAFERSIFCRKGIRDIAGTPRLLFRKNGNPCPAITTVSNMRREDSRYANGVLQSLGRERP